jgi:glycerophosphoryl diester phosphodiesterase|tara:strand:+ start:818 stop:1747 length:930 start_codon:yes stop_codon:yes gene_type:complete
LNRITVHGHRGARGLAPENTLASFQRACAIGVDGLEFDVMVSADDRIVIHHDARLNPMLCRSSAGCWLEAPTPRIRELAARDLGRYDVGRARPGSAIAQRFFQQTPSDGAGIPLLTDLAELWHTLHPVRPLLNIELKSDPHQPADTPAPERYAAIILEELYRLDLHRHCWLQAFDWRLLRAVQHIDPTVVTGYLSSERNGDATIRVSGTSPWLAGFDPHLFGGSLPAAISAAGGTVWGPCFDDLSTKRVAQAHAIGLRVHSWTLNEPEQINRAIDLNLDGFSTDYPDRARALLLQSGLVTAPPCTAANA